MEFSMKKMRTLKSAMAVLAPVIALCYLFSLNVIVVSAPTKKLNQVALIRSDRSIENMNQRAWYQSLLPKQPMRAIAMKK